MDTNKQITRLMAVALMGILAFFAVTAHHAKVNRNRQNYYCCVQQEATQ
ncbi:MAG: hypothetical protein ACYSUT_10985 [Planctomycetota bacterium]|jgi:hypothetical protein